MPDNTVAAGSAPSWMMATSTWPAVRANIVRERLQSPFGVQLAVWVEAWIRRRQEPWKSLNANSLQAERVMKK